MEGPKRQITARIPEEVFTGIMKKAEERNLTFTDILIEALKRYLGDELPGLCPSCHTQNDPDAKFCSQCGQSFEQSSDEINLPPIPKSLESYILKQREKQEKLEQKIEQMNEQINKIIKMSQIIEKHKVEHSDQKEN